MAIPAALSWPAVYHEDRRRKRTFHEAMEFESLVPLQEFWRGNFVLRDSAVTNEPSEEFELAGMGSTLDILPGCQTAPRSGPSTMQEGHF